MLTRRVRWRKLSPSKRCARDRKRLPGFLLASAIRAVRTVRSIRVRNHPSRGFTMSTQAARDEILCGGDAIAQATGLPKRAVYHHAQAGRLPTWKLGATLCCHRSAVEAWLRSREAEARQAMGNIYKGS